MKQKNRTCQVNAATEDRNQGQGLPRGDLQGEGFGALGSSNQKPSHPGLGERVLDSRAEPSGGHTAEPQEPSLGVYKELSPRLHKATTGLSPMSGQDRLNDLDCSHHQHKVFLFPTNFNKVFMDMGQAEDNTQLIGLAAQTIKAKRHKSPAIKGTKAGRTEGPFTLHRVGPPSHLVNVRPHGFTLGRPSGEGGHIITRSLGLGHKHQLLNFYLFIF